MQGLERTPIGGSKWGISLWEFQVWDGPEPQPTSRTFPGLVPLPQQVEELDADPFVLDSATSIEASGEAVAVAEVLAGRFRTSTGFDLPVVADAPANSIRFVLDEGFESLGGASPEEGYELTVGADAVVITAGDPHGLFNGTATLRQLFPAMIESSTVVNTAWSAPAVEIADAPRFVHRGIQLDPARSFVEVDEVKAIIDTIASFKQTRFHFHLADDQGWRIEITNEGRAAGDEVDYTKTRSTTPS